MHTVLPPGPHDSQKGNQFVYFFVPHVITRVMGFCFPRRSSCVPDYLGQTEGISF